MCVCVGGGGGDVWRIWPFTYLELFRFVPLLKCLYLNGMLKMCLTELN